MSISDQIFTYRKMKFTIFYFLQELFRAGLGPAGSCPQIFQNVGLLRSNDISNMPWGCNIFTTLHSRNKGLNHPTPVNHWKLYHFNSKFSLLWIILLNHSFFNNFNFFEPSLFRTLAEYSHTLVSKGIGKFPCMVFLIFEPEVRKLKCPKFKEFFLLEIQRFCHQN